jgi:hypothetical protein
VTIDLEALQDRSGGAALMESMGRVSAETARRLACDASVSRAITRGRSEPLDVGRRTSVVPPAIRRALIVRDGGGAFPSCDRPSRWTDAHHVRHWADGGPTSLANLTLLCRPHHRSIHDGAFSVQIEGSRPTFRRADRSRLDDRAPP